MMKIKVYFFKGSKTQFTCKAKTCFYFGKFRGIISIYGFGVAFDYSKFIL